LGQRVLAARRATLGVGESEAADAHNIGRRALWEETRTAFGCAYLLLVKGMEMYLDFEADF
jgi:hypothetical protein